MNAFEEYQENTKVTAIYPKDKAVEYCALGLASEVGEVLGKLKKVIRGDRKLDADARAELAAELGDVLWYTARLADELNLSLDGIADANIEKLIGRLERDIIKGDGDNR